MTNKKERPAPAGIDTPPSVLSARELETAIGIARGETCREIAARLGISVKTIDTHRGHVLAKLGLRLSTDVVLWAVRWGIVLPSHVRDVLVRSRDLVAECSGGAGDDLASLQTALEDLISVTTPAAEQRA